MIGEVVETSASFEARFRATTLPDLETMPIIFLAGAFLTEFLDYPDENKAAVEMFNDFLQVQVESIKLDELIANPPDLS
jgi:hypothetical protein